MRGWTLTVTRPFPLLSTLRPLSLPIHLPPSPPLCLPFSPLSLLCLFHLLLFHLPILLSIFHPSQFLFFGLIRTPSPPTPHSCSYFTLFFHLRLAHHTSPHPPSPPPTPSPSLCSHCSVSNGSAPSQQIHQAGARRADPTNAFQPLALSRLTAGKTWSYR